MTVTPELVAAEDENGNDLLYLGLLTGTGFQTPTETFIRNKGKSKAIGNGNALWKNISQQLN